MNVITYNMAPVLGDYHSHVGFWLVLGFVVSFFAVTYSLASIAEEDYTPYTTTYIYATISAFTIGVVGFNSFGKGSICENTPVVAELIDKTFAETYQIGRYSSVVDTHVIYKTPDGEVTYRRENGKIYPRQATIYKTICTEIK